MDNLLPEALARPAHCHPPAALTHLQQLEAESIDIDRTRVTMCWRQLQPLLARKGGSLLRQIQPLLSNPQKPLLESLRRAPPLCFFRRFINELAPDGIVATVLTGLVALILVVVESLSYAALIFSGPLSPFIGVGIAITLNTAVVVGLITAVFGSYPGTIAFSQNKIAALMAFMAAALMSSMANSLPGEKAALTVAAAIFVSTVITGAALAGLGAFRLGALARFIPYPVICGFLASVGWLLCLGAFKTLAGFAVTADSFPVFFQLRVMAHWAPGAAFAVFALIVMHRIRHYAVMPLLMLATVCCFYLALLLSGMSVGDAQHTEWLVHIGSTNNLFKVLTFEAISEADLGLVALQAGSIATIILVTAVGLLLNSSALELAAGCDIDLDRELKIGGIANVLAGLSGGMVGFTSVNISKFVLSTGVRGRLVGLMCALGCAAILVGGAQVIGFVPRLLIGGLLLYIGLEFLYEWLYRPAREFYLGDFAIVVIILTMVSLVGLIQGLIVGIVSAIIIFTVKYSGLNVVKLDTTIAEFRSTVHRTEKESQLLAQEGHRARILQLRDFVFFGSANTLLTRIRSRINDQEVGRRYLVIDFRFVTGIDLSAIMSFVRLGQLARNANVTIVLTQVSQAILRQMAQGGLFAHGDAVWKVLPSLDLGVECCEDQLLDKDTKLVKAAVALPRFLQENGFSAQDAEDLNGYVVRSRYPIGDKLIWQGERSDALYFLESGVVAVQVNLDNGSPFRVAKFGAGSFVGEIGFYLQTPRTADVIIEEDATICCLSRSNAASLKRNAPQLASSFNEVLIYLLANRLVLTDRILSSVLM
jgi:sulfate permease, SulP family